MRTVSEWKGTISRIGQRNILTDSYHRNPLEGHEFPDEKGPLMIYLMSSSPGLFNGDEEFISCRLTEGAQLFLTTPSPSELRPSPYDEESRQTQTFFLEPGSILEYLPELVIPFKDSNFRGTNSVYMSKGSQAIISEIVTAGRIGRDEIFQYKKFSSTFEVYWENKLQVWDCMNLDPASNLRGAGNFGEYTHVGTLWILSEQVTDEHLNYIQNTILADEGINCYGSASLLQTNGLVIRLLGNSAQDLQNVIKKCWDHCRGELFQIRPFDIRI
ncbi:urease accessory protein [Scopulibacillus darangshiensis]|uniref:Urease accessory protein UreD n=2 Tax=Scopulibacillus darangshiensis TaxID=442528 RepID=A0A4R2NK44_9BACL|nr:urease accessory protein [Scopulibacillus darangshiensis]